MDGVTKIINVGSRKLGYKEYGHPKGQPVFYFHGFPGSRLDGVLLNFDTAGCELNLRIICIDRPGIGISDFQNNRLLINWANDVATIANHLEIDQFAVIGLSAGGPYALACAHALEDRITAVSLVSSMVPSHYPLSDRNLSMFLPNQPSFLRPVTAWAIKKGLEKSPETVKRIILKYLSEPDKQFLATDTKEQDLLETFHECFRQGIRGYIQESRIYQSNWGFSLSNIKTKITLWHGAADKNVSKKNAERLAEEMTDCKVIILPDEGHFSLAGNHVKSILRELIAGQMKAAA